MSTTVFQPVNQNTAEDGCDATANTTTTLAEVASTPFTFTNRPCIISIEPAAATGTVGLEASHTSGPVWIGARVTFFVGSQEIATFTPQVYHSGAGIGGAFFGPGQFLFQRAPGTGTNTVSVKIAALTGGHTVRCLNLKLVVREI